MEKIFDDILEKDEKIIKVIKPSKRRYWKEGYYPMFFIIPIIGYIIFFAVTLFMPIFFYAHGYKNLYYAYTNKRLIKRSGQVGVDYQSLEYKDITSTNITVGFLDKTNKTGKLSFSSPSTHADATMKWDYVENPYEVMKNIKEYMNENK